MSLLDDLQRYPITGLLAIGAVATFIAGETGRSVEHLMLLPGTQWQEPWRFVTCLLPHGGAIHLLFNLYWTWLLGRVIEARIGSPGMAVLTLAAALVAGGLELAFFASPIGLSGVVFAYAFFAYARGKHDPRFMGVVDERLARFFVFWFFLCIVLTETGVLGVANAAHFGGGVIGFALGSRIRWLAPAIVAAVGALLVTADAGLLDTSSGQRSLHRRAISAIDQGDDRRAIELYEQIIEKGGRQAVYYRNYGVALQNVGRMDEAIDAWTIAHDIDPKIFTPEEWEGVRRDRAARDSR